jgi:hypothetical protein
VGDASARCVSAVGGGVRLCPFPQAPAAATAVDVGRQPDRREHDAVGHDVVVVGLKTHYQLCVVRERNAIVAVAGRPKSLRRLART